MFLCQILIVSLLLVDLGNAFSKRMLSNAKSIKSESFPYVAELRIAWLEREVVCTASLLSRSIIITAAHCLFDEETKKQQGKVKRVIFRRDYGLALTWVTDNIHGMLNISDLEREEGVLDYALLELKEPLPVCQFRNKKIFSIIKLPVLDIRARKWKTLQPSKKLFHQCSIFGYGASEKDDAGGRLRKLTNITVKEANGRLLMSLENNARQGRICDGDSGGPLVCSTDFGERIFGILSYSEPLLDSFPSSCYGEKSAFLYDVIGDARKMLPYIQDSFSKMNKTEQLIEDYERCNF